MTSRLPLAIPILTIAFSVSFGTAAIAQNFPLGQRTQLTYQVEQTRQPTAGDFNGDGHVDVLVSSATTAGINILVGDGQAGFAEPLLITDFDRQVLDFAAADLDGDGDLDVAALVGAGGDGPERLVRLLNNGSGIFASETVRENTGIYEDLQVADLTEDGALDLVLSRFIGGAYELVYLAAQGAGYAAPSSTIANGSTANFTIVDVDGDGILDLATNSGTQNELWFSKGLGGGTFATGTIIQAAGGTTIQSPSRLLDIDGDGDTDCLQLTGMAMRYFDGLGGGSFASPTIIGAGSFVLTTQVFDADGDGDLDIANTQAIGPPPFFPLSETKIFLQASPGVFGPGVSTLASLVTPSGAMSSMAIADIDGNGRVDLLRDSGSGNDPLVWQLNNQPASAGFFNTNDFLASGPFSTVARVAGGDIDGDGDDDVVISNSNNGAVGWIQNFAPGVTAPPEVLFTTTITAGALHVIDVDGDLDSDIVARSTQGSGPEAMEFWINDGNMGFSRASTLTPFGAGLVRTFHIEDMDGDGDADVLISRFTGNFGDQEAWLYTNTGGAAAFTPTLVVYASVRAVDVRVGEFNGDGNRDLAIMRFIGLGDRYRLETYLGLGGGSFGSPTMALGLARARTLTTGDFNSDGLDDLFVWDQRDGVVLRRAVGGGVFEIPIQLLDAPLGGSSTSVYPLDFDADGDTDILFGTSYPYLAEQTPGGVLRDGFPIGVFNYLAFGALNSERAQFADLDGDGDGDWIAAEFGSAVTYENFGIVNVGSSFCTDSQIVGATLTAVGSEVLTDNRIALVSSGIQPNVFGIAVSARTYGPPALVAGTQGFLCLTGPIGRYDGPGQILQSGAAGLMTLDLDLGALETPGGSVPGQAGESWSFQIWHRQPGFPPPAQTSRFTTGVTVQLR